MVRETEFELLRARHATREQCRFFLESRGQSLEDLETKHLRFQSAFHHCRAVVPSDWRQAIVNRSDFDRFLFGPEDIIVAVGQDGLIANIAKYLDGQPVFGVNPDPDQYDGVLAKFAPAGFGEAINRWRKGGVELESRTMVKAELDSGESLIALNEIFIGHKTHQSARYKLAGNEGIEIQSSSGLIVASGTGATGWARSIMEATGTRAMFRPTAFELGYFVREPFPSNATGTALRTGWLRENDELVVTSMMNDGGTIFADGIEKDRLPFDWGRIVCVSIAAKRLSLALN